MPAYRNDYFFVEHNLIEQPDSIKARTMRALNKFKSYDIPGAYFDYFAAYHYCEHDFKVNYNIANMTLALGNAEEAIEFADKAEKSMYEHSGIGDERELLAELRENIKILFRDGYISPRKVRVLK
uniref:Tetratricopeptide repeat protein n=1 Tax=viral metagenome TaxID=1070528 RepID=A0A6M3IKG0_9ZZZZ